MAYKETVVHGRVNTEHLVQLFDSPESLADTVSEFLLEGFQRGETLLVVSTQNHWDDMATRLTVQGVSLDDAFGSGQLTMRNASETLRLFMRNGTPDRSLFEASVGQLVRELAARGKGLRIYGEMVDRLAAEGDYRSAQALEELWNGLSERESFVLFCGYSAVNFGDPRNAEALRSICAAHSHVRSNPIDVLASFLLRAHAAAERASL